MIQVSVRIRTNIALLVDFCSSICHFQTLSTFYSITSSALPCQRVTDALPEPAIAACHQRN